MGYARVEQGARRHGVLIRRDADRPGPLHRLATFLALYLLAPGVKSLQLAGGRWPITFMLNVVAVIVAVQSLKRRDARLRAISGRATVEAV